MLQPPEFPAVAELPVQRWPATAAAHLKGGHVGGQVDGRAGEPARGTTDHVAEEAPVAIEFAGRPHVVMLATPTDLEDLATGFVLSEQLAAGPEEILGIRVVAGEAERALHEPLATVQVDLPTARLAEVFRRKRNLSARSGCGLCGVETADSWARDSRAMGSGWRVTPAELHAALAALEAAQVAGRLTGGLHAAGWALPGLGEGRGLQLAREDVGRHNALDKVLGAVVRSGQVPAAGYLLTTSRASFELVQKGLALGVGLLVAVSAPTALAVRAAAEGGMTLVGFARPGRHVIYAHPERMAESVE